MLLKYTEILSLLSELIIKDIENLLVSARYYKSVDTLSTGFSDSDSVNKTLQRDIMLLYYAIAMFDTAKKENTD